VSVDGFRVPITQLHSDDQHLTMWLLLVGIILSRLEIACVLLWKPFQPYVQGRPLQHESDESCLRVTDAIPLPRGRPLWPSQTSTCSVLEISPSSSEKTSVHRLVS
jgi:hypothetical protein